MGGRSGSYALPGSSKVRCSPCEGMRLCLLLDCWFSLSF
ncbi:MAG: hypothetical protein FJZ95_07905 [Chloroflexi bacterium]|nr:hypothetical protein [Chloroflexota bacterium]